MTYLLFTVIVFGFLAVMWKTDKTIYLRVKGAAFALAILLGWILLLYNMGFYNQSS
jgi:hypothetical protein